MAKIATNPRMICLLASENSGSGRGCCGILISMGTTKHKKALQTVGRNATGHPAVYLNFYTIGLEKSVRK
jgi:hypothetical protein